MKRSLYQYIIDHARKVVVFVIGMTLLIIGIVMVVLPGPALVVIPLAIFILSTEFVWARRFLKTVKKMTDQQKKK